MTFTLVGNACPLTRITATNKVPLREPIPLDVVGQEYIVTKVYTRRPKVVQIFLWYLDSGCSKHMTGNRSQLTNFVHKFLDTVMFGNDQIAKIIGYYESVGISHETSVARSPQQNSIVDRQNHTLVEVTRTMLIYEKYPLFLWAEAVTTACYTQNRSIIRRLQGKTSYEFLHDKKPDLSHLHVFGALCYLNSDSEDLGKLQAKADIGIFIGYAPKKKAYRIYNRFPIAAAQRAFDLADSHVSTSIDQDASSTSIPLTQDEEHFPIISQGQDKRIWWGTVGIKRLLSAVEVTVAGYGFYCLDFLGSSSNVRPIRTPFESLGRWTKDNPIANVIRDPSRSISTKKQLQTDAMWCYFDAFLTSVKPKNFKQAMTESSWIDAMFLALGWHLEEIHVTWAHLEKKRMRLQTCTKIHQEVLFSDRVDDIASIKRRHHDLSGDGIWILAMTSQCRRLKESATGRLQTLRGKAFDEPSVEDFAKMVKAITLPQDVPSTYDRCLIELENQVQRLMEAHLAPTQPAQMNKITTSCEICSGPQDTQYCMKYPEQAFFEYASSHTDEA
nr:retrovirus-related Pol polyprotein from transposon TNT 1-94 [Tanacetum cinerariifolium]